MSEDAEISASESDRLRDTPFPQPLAGPASRPRKRPPIETSKAAGYTIFDAGLEYGKIMCMESVRKITVEVPRELLEKARRASGAGITGTVRSGLELVAASRTYARLRQLRGKVHFARTWAELKADR